MKHLAISNHVDSSHDRGAGARSFSSLNRRSTPPPLSPMVSTRRCRIRRRHGRHAQLRTPPLAAAACC